MLHTDDDQTKALPLELRLTAVTVHVRSGHWRKSPKRQPAPARFQSFQRRPFGDFQKPPRGGFFLLCGGLPASLPEKRRKPDTAAAFVGSARAHNGSTGPRRCCPMVGGTRPFAVVRHPGAGCRNGHGCPPIRGCHPGAGRDPRLHVSSLVVPGFRPPRAAPEACPFKTRNTLPPVASYLAISPVESPTRRDIPSGDAATDVIPEPSGAFRSPIRDPSSALNRLMLAPAVTTDRPSGKKAKAVGRRSVAKLNLTTPETRSHPTMFPATPAMTTSFPPRDSAPGGERKILEKSFRSDCLRSHW